MDAGRKGWDPDPWRDLEGARGSGSALPDCKGSSYCPTATPLRSQAARLRPWPAFLWCLHSLLSSQADLSSSRTFLPIKALYLLLLIIPDRFRTDSRAKNSRLALHSRWKPKDGFEQKVLDLLELLQSYPAVSSAVLRKSRSFRC